jgi:predicted outer membrane repeat protein
VNSLADTGAGSGNSGDLRYCLTQAQTDASDTTITFGVTGTITLEHALPDLRKLTTPFSLLDVEGAGAVTVQRDPALTTPFFSVFTVGQTGAAGAVRVAGLTIRDGNAGLNGHGGGVLNAGARTVLAGCVFVEDSAGHGGAVSNSGNLLLDRCTFTGDSADYGGAVEAGGTLTVRNCTFTGNSAAFNGGALYGGGRVSVADSTFTGNSANFDGGALYALSTSQGVWVITDTALTGNSAGGNGGAVGGDNSSSTFNLVIDGCALANNVAANNGGGLYAPDSATVRGSTFTGNQAATGGAVSGATVAISGSTFRDNSAVSGGAVDAAFVTIGNSTFTRNTATNSGGAIAGLSPFYSSTVTGSTFSHNRAVSGGAIAFPTEPPRSNLFATVADCRFTHNSATNGGALYGSVDLGGAGSTDLVAVTASSFTHNSATNDGGAIDIAAPASASSSSAFEITTDNCAFAGNRAGGNGGAIANSDTLAVSRSTFAGNSAADGGAVYDGLGHGFSPSAAPAQVVNSTFTQNSATLGGAVYGSSPAGASNGLQISFSTLAGNQVTPAGHGGGVYGPANGFVSNIVAGNTRGASSDDISGGVGGLFAGYNLVGDGTGSNLVNGANHNIVGTAMSPVDPLLGPLQDNGGPTFTLALLPGSPALDAGGSSDPSLHVPGTDQRGYLRVFNGQPDIGAFEFQPLTLAYTVTTLADSGPGSLRDAITRAEATPAYRSTIAFTVTGTIDLLSALPSLTAGLVIQGPGASLLTVQRDAAVTTPQFSDFVVAPGAAVEISGLTIRGGRQTGTGGQGGGIFNAGTLRLSACTLTGNQATAGGGIYDSFGASLTAEGCTVTANQAGSVGGGGIYADNGGTVTVSGSTVSGNLSGGAGGGLALYNLRTTLRDSTVSDNQAVTSVFNVAGAGIANASALTIANSTVSGNSALPDSSNRYNGEGGGVYNTGALTIDGSTFMGNTAGLGGALFTATAGLPNSAGATVAGSTFANNSATGDAPLTDQTGGLGGAIDNGSGSLTVTDSTFANNSASGYGYFGGSAGGAIANAGTLTLSNSTFYGNSATGSTTAPGSGGALYTGTVIGGTSSATVTNSTFFGNSADGNGGAINAASGALVVNNSTLAGNQAGNSGQGGGAYVSSGIHVATVTLYDTIVAGNRHGTVGDDVFGFVSPATSIFNLIGDGTGGGLSDGIGGNRVGTASNPIDPLLGPLQDNGGPTWTMALLPGSPALDAGDNDGVPATDQRGLPRVVGGTVDIGAFEAQPGAATQLVVRGPSRGAAGVPFDVTVVALDAYGHVATGYAGTLTFSTTDSDLGVLLPADYTFTACDQGTHAFRGGFTLISAGDQTLTVDDLAAGLRLVFCRF